MAHFWKANFWTLIISTAALLALMVWHGLGALLTALVLVAIELAFSFDNAVVNAKILERLSPLWQKLFLTIGMVVAIVGMRLVFPIVIVAIGAGLSYGEVVRLALHDPKHYAHYLELAHAPISAFGGGFLLTLALYFLFDDKREIRWLKRLETAFAGLGGHWWLAPVMALMAIAVAALVPANHHLAITLKAGAMGVILYVLLHQGMALLGRLEPKTPDRGSNHVQHGWAAFGGFMYLQLLDASFSFDGVLGAFAITSDIVLIAIGLGVGALWVRSLTVQLVRHKTLDALPYLEHGAHYAILALALALLVSISWAVPDILTGFIGLVIIGAALRASQLERRARQKTGQKIA